jgi:hypothetical protein
MGMLTMEVSKEGLVNPVAKASMMNPNEKVPLAQKVHHA